MGDSSMLTAESVDFLGARPWEKDTVWVGK